MSTSNKFNVITTGITNAVSLLKHEHESNLQEIVSINHLLDKRESIRLEGMSTEIKIETIQASLISTRVGLYNRTKVIEDQLEQVQGILTALVNQQKED